MVQAGGTTDSDRSGSPPTLSSAIDCRIVYTLWRNPHLIPLLFTPGFVVEKLQTGSPLMTPGLAGGPPFPATAKTGALVAVASLDQPTVPRVVGTCEIDVSALERVQGSKGHAVRSDHWEGDELWSWSTNASPGRPAPNQIEGRVVKSEQELSQEMDRLQVEDEQGTDEEEGGVALPLPDTAPKRNDFVEGEDIEHQAQPEKEMSTKEIDNAFWQAFLYGAHDAKRKNPEGARHGLSFPIPQSLVISNLVLPYLPTHTAYQTTALNIKKTSWKNAKKFIKALDKAKLLKSKDRDGGECVVLDIDFEDTAVVAFKPYRLPKKTTKGPGEGESGPASSGDLSVGQSLQLLISYKPKEAFAPLFAASDADARALYTAPELRAIVTSYLEVEKLVHATNKRLIKLDPFLSNTVFTGKAPIDREVIAKGTIPRDALIDRIRDACAPYYTLLRKGDKTDAAKPKAGKPPKVSVTLETRSGNKTVTKTSGLEAFFVNPAVLGEELQKSCASSTSVGQLVGSSPRNPVMEVLVQGPQQDNVIKALEKRGVDRRWIEVTDKTKGKKKG